MSADEMLVNMFEEKIMYATTVECIKDVLEMDITDEEKIGEIRDYMDILARRKKRKEERREVRE